MAESNLPNDAFFPPATASLRVPCPFCGANPARRPTEVKQEILNGRVGTLSFICTTCGKQPFVLATDDMVDQLHAAGVHGPTVLFERGIPIKGVLVTWYPGSDCLDESIDDSLTLHLD